MRPRGDRVQTEGAIAYNTRTKPENRLELNDEVLSPRIGADNKGSHCRQGIFGMLSNCFIRHSLNPLTL